MAERIEHTPFEWVVWRGRFVLFRRVTLKPIWGVCVFVAGYIAALALIFGVLLLISGAPEKTRFHPIWIAPVAVVSVVFAIAFVRVYKSDKGVLVPDRFWSVGTGVQLSCKTMSIPQPTTFGGTLPGYPTRWLVVEKPGGKTSRLKQVYHDLDLLKANLALARTA